MNTAGWDTICALRLEEVNRILEGRRDALLQEIEVREETGPMPVWLQAELEPWRVVPGGGGQLLHVEIPFGSGTFRSGGAGHEEKSDLSGLCVRVEVSLQLLPSRTQESGRELRFDFRAVGSEPGRGGPGVVTPLQVVDPEERLSSVQRALLPDLVARELVARAEAIAFAFAHVNLVAPGSGSWLAPVSCEYAWLQPASGPGLLAILAATDDRDVSGLPRVFDVGLSLGDRAAYFVVAGEHFLRRVVLPSLPACFAGGTKASDFHFDAKRGSIRNASPVGTKGVKSGLVTYYPTIQSFELALAGSELRTHVRGTCDMGLGISLDFEVSSRNASRFDAKTRRLAFAADPNPAAKHQTHIPWYAWLGGALVALIVNIVVPIIGSDIASRLSTQLAASPPIDGCPWVSWGGLREMTVHQAGVQDALYVMGDLG